MGRRGSSQVTSLSLGHSDNDKHQQLTSNSNDDETEALSTVDSFVSNSSSSPSFLGSPERWCFAMMWLATFIFFASQVSQVALGAAYSSYYECSDPCVPGSEEIMSTKEHGTSHTAVQTNLRWDCSFEVADRICNYNRHYAEYAGYWLSTTFLDDTAEARENGQPVEFYDSNTGNLLFTAPIDRSWDDFIAESERHGWPSFRDDEVNWETVRVLSDGETVSVDGTHLGHNLPDRQGRRYCINLVSIAGQPVESNN